MAYLYDTAIRTSTSQLIYLSQKETGRIRNFMHVMNKALRLPISFVMGIWIMYDMVGLFLLQGILITIAMMHLTRQMQKT